MTEEIKVKKITDLTENGEISDEDLFMAGASGTASLRRIAWKTIWSKIKTSIANMVVQNATTAATDKLVSAAVAKDLQDQITEQNTNLTKKTITDLTESVTSGYTIRAMRSGNILQVVVNIPSGANGWSTAGKIAQKYAPFDLTPMAVRASSGGDNIKLQGLYVHTNGGIAGYITSALTTDARATATYIV